MMTATMLLDVRIILMEAVLAQPGKRSADMTSLRATLVTAPIPSSAVKLMKSYVLMQIIIQLVVLPLHRVDALVPLDKRSVVVFPSGTLQGGALSFVVRKKRATMMRPGKKSVAQLLVRAVPAPKVKQSAVHQSIGLEYALLSVALMTRRLVTMIPTAQRSANPLPKVAVPAVEIKSSAMPILSITTQVSALTNAAQMNKRRVMIMRTVANKHVLTLHQVVVRVPKKAK
jgi:hypothetical protein